MSNLEQHLKGVSVVSEALLSSKELFQARNAIYFENKFGILIITLIACSHHSGRPLSLVECLRKTPLPNRPYYQAYRSYLRRLESRGIIEIAGSEKKSKKTIIPGPQFPFSLFVIPGIPQAKY